MKLFTLSKENESSGTHPLQFSLAPTKEQASAMIIVLRMAVRCIFVFACIDRWMSGTDYVARKTAPSARITVSRGGIANAAPRRDKPPLAERGRLTTQIQTKHSPRNRFYWHSYQLPAAADCWQFGFPTVSLFIRLVLNSAIRFFFYSFGKTPFFIFKSTQFVKREQKQKINFLQKTIRFIVIYIVYRFLYQKY